MLTLFEGFENIMNEEAFIKELRKKIFYTAFHGNTGHLASAFSTVEILYVLYFKKILRYKADNPDWDIRDKFIMSKGQGSLALYVVLSKAGYFPESELRTFCRPMSKLGGEPKLRDIPGVEASTGSLGHGLPFAAGIAMAHKTLGNPGRVYVLIGDGECQEGSVWETAMSAYNFRLDNLIVLMDNNKLQAMDSVKELMRIDDWSGKWKEFGWSVLEVNGHSVSELEAALREHPEPNKPKIIIANTIKGKGVSFMENVPIWHFRMPNQDELKIVMKELEMSEEELNI